MAAIHDRHWYNENDQRGFPVSDNATAIDDSGEFLPSDLIVELRLRIPANLGKVAYIKTVSSSEKLATIVVYATTIPIGYTAFDPQTAPPEGEPIAAAYITSSNQIFQVVPLEPLTDGVYGWVVFGNGAFHRQYIGRFTSPLQSQLADQCVKTLPTLQVPNVGILSGLQSLAGDVRLRSASGEITISRQSVVVEGKEIDGIVFDLEDQLNALSEYAGPCDARPEENNCPNGLAIESVADATPDCDGRVTIRFNGCMRLRAIESDTECGVIVECDQTIGDVCPPIDIPEEGLAFPADDCE